MMKYNPTGYNSIVKLPETISAKFANFLHSETDSTDLFMKYDSVAAGLKANYDDFYIYKNLNEQTIISANEEKIKAFCGYINRLTN